MFFRRLLIILAFFTAFFVLLYSARVIREIKLRGRSGRDADSFSEAPSGFFLFRGDIYDSNSIESWRSMQNMGVQNSRFAIFSLGMYASQVEKDYLKAISYFERVMTEYPQQGIFASALFECGVCQMLAGFGDAGERTLMRFCREFPKSWRVPAAKMYIAILYRESGRFVEAIALFEQIAYDFPDSPQFSKALLSVLEIYKKQGNKKEIRRIESLLSAHN